LSNASNLPRTHARTIRLATVLAIALVASLSFAGDRSAEAIKATGAAAGGAAVGGATFLAVGSGGLAIAGTAITVGAAPFIVVGSVLGLAGYGVYRAASDFIEPSSTSPTKKPVQPGQAYSPAKR